MVYRRRLWGDAYVSPIELTSKGQGFFNSLDGPVIVSGDNVFSTLFTITDPNLMNVAILSERLRDGRRPARHLRN